MGQEDHTMGLEGGLRLTSDIDRLSITTARMLAVDGVEAARSGHPGLPLGAAPLAYTIFLRHLRFDPTCPEWPGRDRFILSPGHGSMLLYALLNLFGYDLPVSQLERFRQWGSKTPGHPEYGHTVGVETTTGPLGQGFATGVGMAMAARHWAGRLGGLMDFRVFALVSDGDLMEGLSHEAASLAGHLSLGNLIYVYDQNHISIEGSTDLAFTEDVGERFAGYGWHVLAIRDTEDVDAIDAALKEAEADPRPSLLIARTHIGFGSPLQDTAKVHGAAMGRDNQLLTRRAFGWPEDASFRVPDEVRVHLAARIRRGREAREAWEKDLTALAGRRPDEVATLRRALSGALPDGALKALPTFSPADGPLATRQASGRVLNAIAREVPELLGGSADLAPSTDTWLEGEEAMKSGDASGRNIHFGVREHAMGAALNGLALSGLRPFGGTFLIFSDYMRPAIRLAALMGLPVTYVFTHDSIGLGEDGPTHQPVEQAMSLRLIPNLVVIRPADATETVEAWKIAMERRDGPTALLLTRQRLPVLDRSILAPARVADGGYILKPVPRKPDIVLGATGSEVHIALEAAGALLGSGVAAQVVSVPSFELLRRRQGAQAKLFPPDVPSLSVEAGTTHGWGDLTTHHMGIDRFGASAPYEEIYRHLHLTPADVAARALEVLGREA